MQPKNFMKNWKDGLLEFYKGKRILITGHTGFKGTWLTRILLNAGAIVAGYALPAPTNPALFDFAGISGNSNFTNITGDIRNFTELCRAFAEVKPEIVFHLAAQPIVRDSYKNPRDTYETNLMGTVNILEAVRTTLDENQNPVVKSFLNITTDKVYQNKEWVWGYRENEPLDGFDPYSNSKSCSELATHSYQASFFEDNMVRVSTARAGNVIGGGDFANDRIIPDAVRAVQKAYENKKESGTIFLRNPYSTRPYQHVLEPLAMYLLIVMSQYKDKKYAGYYNVGPEESDCITTGELASLFCEEWNKEIDNMNFKSEKGTRKLPRAVWEGKTAADVLHEANFLKLDCSKAKGIFGWKPCWNIRKAVEKTVHFSRLWITDIKQVQKEMDLEIKEFFEIL